MSKKHVRRVEFGFCDACNERRGHPRAEEPDCTVVHDSACFPVREAMRLCKAINVHYDNPSGDMSTWNNALNALHLYRDAVASMKAKKGSK
jgi:hypothetical protein